MAARMQAFSLFVFVETPVTQAAAEGKMECPRSEAHAPSFAVADATRPARPQTSSAGCPGIFVPKRGLQVAAIFLQMAALCRANSDSVAKRARVAAADWHEPYRPMSRLILYLFGLRKCGTAMKI
jgi:hypothetical protein